MATNSVAWTMRDVGRQGALEERRDLRSVADEDEVRVGVVAGPVDGAGTTSSGPWSPPMASTATRTRPDASGSRRRETVAKSIDAPRPG